MHVRAVSLTDPKECDPKSPSRCVEKRVKFVGNIQSILKWSILLHLLQTNPINYFVNFWFQKLDLRKSQSKH